MDYIACDTIKEFLKRVIFGADQKIDTWVDAMPAADVQPISGGHWIVANNPNYSPFDTTESNIYFCSNCGAKHEHATSYCSRCGAKMRGGNQPYERC